MGMAEEIERLNQLKQSGAISEEEFERGKQALLAGNQAGGRPPDLNMWGMFIHLSQFASYILPLAGLIVPIVLWQTKKNEGRIIDRHGRIVMNWLITELILGIVFVVLSFVVIGIPFLIALGIVGIIFPIIGAVKASNGEAWPYPLSIRFFRLD
jgi:uncharacterized Tic20 family protein